ncbi:hypothetical protein JTE90_011041 [Oedothorax gibbosus]|uniref:Uncharacterized protein n=1 Tax=Oedothorax gibbosus TaxID=931172 RepID=A0AAV6VFD3_9ARAC|nr:hypothetical protein JTE90_011041 [Oedothorax gibbosus]
MSSKKYLLCQSPEKYPRGCYVTLGDEDDLGETIEQLLEEEKIISFGISHALISIFGAGDSIFMSLRQGPRTTEGCRDESSLVPFISTHSPISTSTVIPFDTLSHSPTYRKEPLSTQGHP